MKVALIKSTFQRHEVGVLRICAVVSFLLIVVPNVDAGPGLMAVVLVDFVRDLVASKTRYLDVFGVLTIAYCVSLFYLLFFGSSTRRSARIAAIVALAVLLIPCLLVVFFLVALPPLLVPSFLTIAIFCYVDIRLFNYYRRGLKKGGG
jgi:hypothetical protein